MDLESDSSLHGLYCQCVESFGCFIVALSDEYYQIIDQSKISESYARIRIWGDQSRAVLPKKARGSLDDLLRHNSDVRKLAFSILCRLAALLQHATDIITNTSAPSTDYDSESASSVSADSIDSDVSSHTSERKRRPRRPRICLVVQQIFDQITSLYDLSSLLRRPQIVNKYISSTRPGKPEIKNTDTIDLNTAYVDLDERHILEKFLQWRGLNKIAYGIDFEGEASASVMTEGDFGTIVDISWFVKRLARANTIRREQLRYWAGSCDDFRQVKNPTANKPSSADPETNPKSEILSRDFSAAPASEVHDARTQTGATTVYAQTAIGQRQSNSMPGPPRKALSAAEFACPFCGTWLRRDETKNRQNWKRHVFRDLRPYVCTFKDCTSADKLYLSRHEWIYHELQIHRRHYLCYQCSYQSNSRESQAEHLRQHHTSVAPIQMSALLDLCDRQCDVDVVKDSCLICGAMMVLSNLQRHLAGHMEDISLIVLPKLDEDEEGEAGSEASKQAAKPASHDETESVGSGELSPSSSGISHDAESFRFEMSMVEDQQDDYLAKFRSWAMTEKSSQQGDQELATEAPSTHWPPWPMEYMKHVYGMSEAEAAQLSDEQRDIRLAMARQDLAELRLTRTQQELDEILARRAVRK